MRESKILHATMQVAAVAGRFVAAMGLLGVGLAACQWVAGIEDIELTSGSASASASGAGSGGTTGASSSATASTSASGAGGAGGAPPTVKYQAAVADCVFTKTPDPDACETSCGAGQMRIDSDDSATTSPMYVFLRFNLDNTIAGRNVTAVTLYLSTTTQAGGDSDHSGEIWEVAPFERASLFMNPLPSDVGGKLIADDLGGVQLSMTYKWSLPTTLVMANMPVYLKVKPTSSNTAWYWNTKGTTTPELVIDLE